VNIEQKLDFITKGLSITGLFNWRAWSTSYYSRSITPYYYRVTDGSWDASEPDKFETELIGQAGTEFINQTDITRNADNTFYLDARLNYNRRFGKHTVGGMLMYMMREYRGGVYPHRNQGLSGRFTYDYNNTYMAEVNFGYNGTERLKTNRFEFFPAMSLGWVISNEKFWKPISKYVDFFKLRASYGLVGNDETGESAGAAHFLYINELSMGTSADYITGPYYGAVGNLDLNGPGIGRYAVENAHWERAKEFDFGFDARIMNDLNITFDYFHNKRDRILMRRGSFPSMLGYWGAVPFSNVGKVDSKGYELSLNWAHKVTKDFNFELRFNWTYTKNKYVYVDEPDYPYVWQLQTGRPIYSCVGYVAEGLFESEEEIKLHADQSGLGSTPMVGDIKYRDINGDGKITSEDQAIISPYGSLPRIQYGIGLSLNYKKFDFGVFFNGSDKTKRLVTGLQPFHGNMSANKNVMQWIADDYWSEDNPNPNASFPRLGLTDADDAQNTPNSTFWLRNFRFIRWKTLELGYSFRYCRLYFSGDNLAVWSPFKEWDPELWWYDYPLQRTFNFGIQVKL
jgi:TonB-linked SusC/RagA family outer membrane protein